MDRDLSACKVRARALETTTVTFDISMTTGNVYSLPQKFSWRRRSFVLCWKQTGLSVDPTCRWILNLLQLRTVSGLNFNNRNLKSYIIPQMKNVFQTRNFAEFWSRPSLEINCACAKSCLILLKPDNCIKYYLSPVAVFKVQKGVFLIKLTRKIPSREKFSFFVKTNTHFSHSTSQKVCYWTAWGVLLFWQSLFYFLA